MLDILNNLTYEQSNLGVILFSLLWGLACSGLISALYIRKKKSYSIILKVILILLSIIVMAVTSIAGASALFSAKKFLIHFLLSMLCNFTLPVIVWRSCSKKARKADMEKLKANPVVNQVIEIAQKTNATAIYCCKDGVRIVHSEIPPITNIQSPGLVTCESLKEFEDTNENFSQITQFHAAPDHCVDFYYSSYNYPSLTHYDLSNFAEVIANALGNYTLKEYSHWIQFTEKGQYYSTGGYTAHTYNGTTTISENTSKTRDKRYSKTINYYAAIIRNDYLPKDDIIVTTEKKLNEW